jgi:hypothetical protein
MDGMPKLSKRSDGAVETESGLFAVVPKYTSGTIGKTSWFAFRTGFYKNPIRVEWETGSALILLPQDIAKAMVRLDYASGVTAELMADYNKAAEEYNAKLAAGGPTSEQIEAQAAEDAQKAAAKAAKDEADRLALAAAQADAHAPVATSTPQPVPAAVAVDPARTAADSVAAAAAAAVAAKTKGK